MIFNLSKNEVVAKYATFKELAQKARKDEINNVGINPLSSLEKYRKAIEVGWSLLRNKDNEKFYELKRYRIVYFIKTQALGIALGIIVGITTSIVGTLIYEKYIKAHSETRLTSQSK